MFGADRNFERDVQMEVRYLRRLHGDDALRIARLKAVRPYQRTRRRKILNATVRRIQRQTPRPLGLFDRLFGDLSPFHRRLSLVRAS